MADSTKPEGTQEKSRLRVPGFAQLQRLGKSLMLPIAVLPAAGILLRLGQPDLLGRISGPMSFRMILQPAVATLLAIRAGMHDARDGRPFYGWSVATDREHRGQSRVLHPGRQSCSDWGSLTCWAESKPRLLGRSSKR